MIQTSQLIFRSTKNDCLMSVSNSLKYDLCLLLEHDNGCVYYTVDEVITFKDGTNWQFDFMVKRKNGVKQLIIVVPFSVISTQQFMDLFLGLHAEASICGYKFVVMTEKSIRK